MEQIVHEFTITRGDNEYELKASFEVSAAIPRRTRRSKRNSGLPDMDPAEGGRASLIGDIFLIGDGIPWEGHLTRKEKDRIENEVYNSYMESNEPSDRNNRPTDDSCLIDGDFDDGFDIDMAVKVSGKGNVFW